MLFSRQFCWAVWGWLGMLVAPAAAQLASVDEAVALSKKTGRPIFAMAGQHT